MTAIQYESVYLSMCAAPSTEHTHTYVLNLPSEKASSAAFADMRTGWRKHGGVPLYASNTGTGENPTHDDISIRSGIKRAIVAM